LEGANLEEITMKTVCKQVYAHYPEFDLAHKKDFIKTTVKSVSEIV
jgi:protein DEK